MDAQRDLGGVKRRYRDPKPRRLAVFDTGYLAVVYSMPVVWFPKEVCRKKTDGDCSGSASLDNA